tara:strand:+ start:159 stop:491 length:333 start_codon:yes stop_codon:yes gene_type:complete
MSKLSQEQYLAILDSIGQGEAQNIASILGVKGSRIKGGKGGSIKQALEQKSNTGSITEAEQGVLALFNTLYDTVEEINTSVEVKDVMFEVFPNFLEGFNLDLNWKDRSKQ